MRRNLTILLLLAGLAGCTADDTGDEPLRFGYFEVDLTPPVGTILGGFGYPGGTRKSTANHDPLLGQAALFVNGAGQSFLLITVDSAGYMYDFGDWGPGIAVLRQRIAEALQGKVDIAPEQVLLTSSHTHAGTDLMGFWVRAGGGADKGLLDWHITELTRAAVAAADALAPAELWLGATTLTGISKRDGPCSDVTDDSVEILQVRAPDGAVRATIAAYALHTTFSGYDNTEVSSDFVWGFREEMAAATGGAPALYIQGAIAAVHDVDGAVPGSGWDQVYAMGKILADSVLSAESGLEPTADTSIEHRHEMFTSACEGDYMTTMYELLDMPKRYVEEQGDAVIVSQLEVSWHRLGPAGFIAWPGEPTPEYGLALKARMSTTRNFMVGLANDSIGYLIDEASVAKDSSGQLEEYELQMGCGRPIGPAAWAATEAMGAL